ncbi:Alpha/Beta hydrolase protein [Catenaria anguillulae PL171]|uniref:Dipeptidyl-peptidase V n=1 Tax=Catenaria anguillulae PL171 TaxID=765915 RepID=A0A1Y2HLE7_9FUNG|nr:Alpha/Beta hydrolase protein [Catenaria anguillulae PL171]
MVNTLLDAAAPLIPVADFFTNPDRALPKLSPDNKFLSLLAPAGEKQNLQVFVQPLHLWRKGTDEGRKQVTHHPTHDIRHYKWTLDSSAILFVQDRGGNEVYHLFHVDVETLVERDLTPFEGFVGVGRAHVNNDWFVGHKVNLNTGVVALNKQDPRRYDLYQLDLNSGELTLHKTVLDGATNAIMDENHVIQAVSVTEPKDGSTTVHIPDGAADNGWTKLLTIDVDKYKTHPWTGKLQLASFNPGRSDWFLLDESLRSDFDRLVAYAKTKDADFDFVMREGDKDDDIWIVRLVHSNAPSSFILYHRNPTKTRHGVDSTPDSHFEYLFTSNSKVAAFKLGRMLSVNFEARDGLPLQAYITYPPHFEDGTKAVPNFRGSTGFNKTLLTSSFKKWGTAMFTDLHDTVEYAVERGIVDREHVAIFGHSFGGYSALLGATLTPEYFPCAVSIAGPSNLKTLLGTVPPFFEAYVAIFHARMGHPEHDSEMLDAVSPVNHAHKIVRPLMIAQGKNDPGVKEIEAEHIVQAIEKHGGSVYYVLYEDEGHDFVRPVNRVDHFQKAEVFLSKYMGDRVRTQDGLSLYAHVKGATAQVRVIGELANSLNIMSGAWRTSQLLMQYH